MGLERRIHIGASASVPYQRLRSADEASGPRRPTGSVRYDPGSLGLRCCVSWPWPTELLQARVAYGNSQLNPNRHSPPLSARVASSRTRVRYCRDANDRSAGPPIIADYEPGRALNPIDSAAVVDAWHHLIAERQQLIAALARVRLAWPDVRGGLEDLAAILTPTVRKARQRR